MGKHIETFSGGFQVRACIITAGHEVRIEVMKAGMEMLVVEYDWIGEIGGGR